MVSGGRKLVLFLPGNGNSGSEYLGRRILPGCRRNLAQVKALVDEFAAVSMLQQQSFL